MFSGLRFLRRAAHVALLVVITSAVAAGAGAEETAETRVAMNRIFQNLRIVLPLSAEPKRFSAPENQKKIAASLDGMAAAAAALDVHGQGFDPGRRFLGRSLARDIGRVQTFYESGEYDRAQFWLRQTVNGCVGCHAQLPSESDSPVAKDFIDSLDDPGMTPVERARLQIATRRFDDALLTMEAFLGSSDLPPDALSRALTQYLLISVRVKKDLKRPIPVLLAVSERPNLWSQMRRNVEVWRHILEEMSARPPLEPTVANARRVLDQGTAIAEYPADRRRLIHDLVASQILMEIVATEQAPGPEQAEAYYLLGITEARIRLDFWRSPADFFLEQAIRLAPHTQTSSRAYRALRDAVEANFSGSSGTHVPKSLRDHLAELRALAVVAPKDRAPGAGGGAKSPARGEPIASDGSAIP